ncbi:MAG: secretin and TonB N-terminal domain-containing protein [Pseudomonadota bacterium]
MTGGDRQVGARLAGLLLLALPGAALLPAPSFAQSDAQLPQQHYDIPAQRLDTALARFAQISHVDIIYDDNLAANRRSAAVLGSFTPQQALARLLVGTGLSSRFTRSNAALVYAPRSGPSIGYRPDSADPVLTLDVMQVRSTPLVGAPPRASFDAYGRHVLTTIDHLLRPDAAQGKRTYRAVMRLWIDRDGAVERLDFAQGSGNRLADQEMMTGIAALQFGRPPVEMPQPIRVQIEAR